MNVTVNPCGKIFFTVFDRIHKGLDEMDFPECDSVVEKTYCRITGNIAGKNCSSTGKGWYSVKDVLPTCSYCVAAPPETEPLGVLGEAFDEIFSD